ncbi:MAG: methyltransferase [Lachnospiraceae bacterium]
MTELWKNGPLYDGGGAFPITTDSVLLADFVRAKPCRAVELCSGAGLISLLLLSREPRLSIDCAEIDPAASAAAAHDFAANGLSDRARPLCLDIRDHRTALPHAACGLAVCNPPYFAEGSGRAPGDGGHGPGALGDRLHARAGRRRGSLVPQDRRALLPRPQA